MDDTKKPFIRIEWDNIGDSRPNLSMNEVDAMMIYAAIHTLESDVVRDIAPSKGAYIAITFQKEACVNHIVDAHNVNEYMLVGIIAFLRIEAERMIAQQIMQGEADNARAFREHFEKKPPILMPDGSAVKGLFDD